MRWVSSSRVSPGGSRRAAALLVAAAAVALTAACGGSSGNSTNGGGQEGAPNGGGRNNAFAAYTACLQKNGVTITMPSGMPRNRPSDGASRGPRSFPSGMPRPSGSAGRGFPGGGFGGGFQKPDNVDDATWQKAQQACASVRPSFGPGNRGGRGNGNNAAFQNCLKDHGVTASAGNLDTNDATVKKALETCRVLQQPQASPTPTS